MIEDTRDEIIFDAADPPPEYCLYRDEGCELAPSCLNCPFPLCVYDDPVLARRYLINQRNRDMALRRQAGFFVSDIAREFGLSRGTASRGIADYEKRQRDRQEEMAKI